MLTSSGPRYAGSFTRGHTLVRTTGLLLACFAGLQGFALGLPAPELATPAVPVAAANAGFTQLVFDDEFSVAPDIGYGTSGHKWNAGLFYQPVPPSSAFSQANGVLTIIGGGSGVFLSTQWHNGAGGTYFTGGYFEARMRCNDWSAFFLYDAARPTRPTPVPGNPLTWTPELDIIETDPSIPTTSVSTLHSNSSSSGGVADLQNAPDFFNTGSILINQWHVYGVLWTKTAVTWYVDGVQTLSVSPYASTWQPMVLVFCAHPGGVAGGASTVMPPTTEVDWVRVWQAP
jgi:hypothetical protein